MNADPKTTPAVSSDESAGEDAGMTPQLAWLAVAAVCLCSAASAVLEALLVPLYAGTVVVPIAVVFALVGNVALPRMALVFVPRTLACVLPFVTWLVVIVVFGISARPEGDVILPGGGTLQYVSYGVMLGGALAGTISVVTAAPTAPPRAARPTEPATRR